MFFLLRMAFWLGLVLVLLPSGTARRAPQAEVGAADALSAASATVHDLKGFCAREPNACSVGSHIATSMGYRARAGAKMLYEFLTEALAPQETGSLAGNMKSAQPGKAAIQRDSQNTLTPGDLAPAWRGSPADSERRHPA